MVESRITKKKQDVCLLYNLKFCKLETIWIYKNENNTGHVPNVQPQIFEV